MADEKPQADPSKFLNCPQMCVHFQGVDFDKDEVACAKGHVSRPDDFRCFENRCPDYEPDGEDMSLLCADILEVLREQGKAMTDDEMATHVMLKSVGRRSNN